MSNAIDKAKKKFTRTGFIGRDDVCDLYDHIKELKARVEAVKKCPVYFEGGVMTIGDDGLFPVGGVMTVVAVLEALEKKDG